MMTKNKSILSLLGIIAITYLSMHIHLIFPMGNAGAMQYSSRMVLLFLFICISVFSIKSIMANPVLLGLSIIFLLDILFITVSKVLYWYQIPNSFFVDGSSLLYIIWWMIIALSFLLSVVLWKKYKFTSNDGDAYEHGFAYICYNSPKTFLQSMNSLIRVKSYGRIKVVVNGFEYKFDKNNKRIVKRKHTHNASYKYKRINCNINILEKQLDERIGNKYNIFFNNCFNAWGITV